MSDDEKLEAILDAAYECFRLHGVRRTTMEDIARHAGMSRPAAYQHVRNKEDAFRRLAERLVAETLERFTAALASDAPLAERLATALAAKLNLTLKLWRESPHAEELLGAGAKISADLTARDHAFTRDALIAAISAERPDVDAAEFAELLMALGRGLQIHSADPEIPTRRLRQGVALLVAGLDHSTTS